MYVHVVLLVGHLSLLSLRDRYVEYHPLAGVKAKYVHLCQMVDGIWQVIPISSNVEFIRALIFLT